MEKLVEIKKIPRGISAGGGHGRHLLTEHLRAIVEPGGEGRNSVGEQDLRIGGAVRERDLVRAPTEFDFRSYRATRSFQGNFPSLGHSGLFGFGHTQS